MKKVNAAYVGKWYGGALLIGAALFALGVVLDLYMVAFGALAALVAAMVIIPGMLGKRLAKSALVLEESFPEKGFSYQHKFTSNTGVFYIDLSGRLGIVWKNNPTELYFADLSKVTDIRTNDGKQLNGTSLVSCRFKLEGKKFKIYTLRVSNGQFSMNDERVIEAIAKADKLCEMLTTAKQNAQSKAAAAN